MKGRDCDETRHEVPRTVDLGNIVCAEGVKLVKIQGTIGRALSTFNGGLKYVLRYGESSIKWKNLEDRIKSVRRLMKKTTKIFKATDI